MIVLTKPLAGVIISLLNQGSLTLLKTAFTDEKGNFELDQLKPYSLKISITHIGYKKYVSSVIVIVEKEFKKQLSPITLSSDMGVQLQEVAVVSKLPFVQRKIDRTNANWYGPRDTQVASLKFSYWFGKNLNSKPKHTGSGSEAEQNRVKG